MKRLFTLLLAAASIGGYAQDTTALRWVGVNESSELIFFMTDSSDLTQISYSYGSCHGIFLNAQDSLLYAVMDDPWMGGDRNLYKVNPFTGGVTLVHDFAGPQYIGSADISDDGKTVYVIEGQAGTTGQITSLDLATMTETTITTALYDGNSSFGMEYHPADSSLYIYEGSWAGATRLQRIDLATLTNTNEALVGWTTQLHGGKWTGTDSVFIVCAGYGCDMLLTDETSNNLTSFYSTCPVNVADIEEFVTLRNAKDKYCPGDSVLISLIYDGSTFTWYKDGVALAETNDSLWVSTDGTYQALFQLDGTSYMWSEEIMITQATVPNVNITQADNDSLICAGETITLTGATGGSLQWYLDGSAIAGATSNTYDATTTGSYNQMKTNLSGCSDTAAVAYVIYPDSPCDAGVEDLDADISIYPNPVKDQLNIQSANGIASVVIVDAIGKEVYRNEKVTETTLVIDFTNLTDGIYLVTVKAADGTVTKKVIK